MRALHALDVDIDSVPWVERRTQEVSLHAILHYVPLGVAFRGRFFNRMM